MNKRLVLDVWKAHKALGIQIVEQEGLSASVNDGSFIIIATNPWISNYHFSLRGSLKDKDFDISSISFNSNEKRDSFLTNLLQIISEELFTIKSSVKYNEECLFSNNGTFWEKGIYFGSVPLPVHLKDKYGLFLGAMNDDRSNVKRFIYCKGLKDKIVRAKRSVRREITRFTWEA